MKRKSFMFTSETNGKWLRDSKMNKIQTENMVATEKNMGQGIYLDRGVSEVVQIINLEDHNQSYQFRKLCFLDVKSWKIAPKCAWRNLLHQSNYTTHAPNKTRSLIGQEYKRDRQQKYHSVTFSPALINGSWHLQKKWD